MSQRSTFASPGVSIRVHAGCRVADKWAPTPPSRDHSCSGSQEFPDPIHAVEDPRHNLVCTADVPDRPGLEPLTVDIELRRGVWIEGKITDKATGRPVRGAVEYFALSGNPNLRDYPGFSGGMTLNHVRPIPDGSYRVVGLPGPGLVAVYRVGH